MIPPRLAGVTRPTSASQCSHLPTNGNHVGTQSWDVRRKADLFKALKEIWVVAGDEREVHHRGVAKDAAVERAGLAVAREAKRACVPHDMAVCQNHVVADVKASSSRASRVVLRFE